MDNYNAIAENYNESEQDAITLWQLGYTVVKDLLGNVEGKQVLDYGCGTGTFSRYLRAMGASVTGVDISENMIKVAKKNSPGDIVYHTLSEAGLDFLDDDSFDFVVSNFVLCTLPTRKEISFILDQLNRILKKGGLFVFMNSNWERSNGKEFISFKLDHCSHLVSGSPVTAIIKTDPPILLHDFFWSQEDYFSLLSKSGFKITDLKEVMAKSDDVPWLDEKEFPPYYAVSAVK
jgi:2-polyprenyl-3-methyl-5-hydroxy-6-metoxy-1,4-benzoquinol methylase